MDSTVYKKGLKLRDEGRRVSIALMTLFQFFSVYSWICVDWIHKSVFDFPFANFYAFLFHHKMVTVFVRSSPSTRWISTSFSESQSACLLCSLCILTDTSYLLVWEKTDWWLTSKARSCLYIIKTKGIERKMLLIAEFLISISFKKLGNFCPFPRFNIILNVIGKTRFHFVTLFTNNVPLGVCPSWYFLYEYFLRSAVCVRLAYLLCRCKCSIV